jgi:hypothetical protein
MNEDSGKNLSSWISVIQLKNTDSTVKVRLWGKHKYSNGIRQQKARYELG